MSAKEPTLTPKVVELKSRANDAFKNGDFQQAYDLYTSAIYQEKLSPALFSNRSAAAIKLENYTQALKDAQKAVKLDDEWDKAYARVAAAHEYLQQFQPAWLAYSTAARLATNRQVRKDYNNSVKRMEGKIQEGVSTQSPYMMNYDQKPIDRLAELEAQGQFPGYESAA